MTLEYLELMEEVKNKAQSRRKLAKSFKSNTRIYDDGSIEVDPQAHVRGKRIDRRKERVVQPDKQD